MGELLLFLRPYQAYGDALFSKHYHINTITGYEGLQLTEMPMAIQTLKFEDIPPAHIRLPSAPQIL